MFPFLGGSFTSFFGGVLVPLFEVWGLPVAFEGAVFLGFSFIFRGEVDVDFFCVFACGVFSFSVGGVDLLSGSFFVGSVYSAAPLLLVL